ncbi:WAT1-related protein [Senna tora]|uniref:WAT1-related protein n=1 Tax=Senna tora TaxID=362788 RepID=A0A834WZN7_9FABA|nr:WAT1-related protein [Senna tora]
MYVNISANLLQGFLAEGLQRTSVGLGSVIIDSQPLTVAVLASLLFGESIGIIGAAGLVFGVIGLVLLEIRFNRPARVNDEVDEIESSNVTTLFPRIGKPIGQRVVVPFNAQAQPVGEVTGLLSGFLGLVVTDVATFPISYHSWDNVPNSYKESCFNSIKILKKNIELHSLPENSSPTPNGLKAEKLEWGNSDQINQILQKHPRGFDLILGADIYIHNAFISLSF